MKRVYEFNILIIQSHNLREKSDRNFLLMILIANFLNIFFSLFYKTGWLVILLLCFTIFIQFLVDVIISDYDFTDGKALTRFIGFTMNSNYFYSIIYILILYKSPYSYYEVYSLLLIQDSYSILVILGHVLFKFSIPTLNGLKYFGILIEYFYLIIMLIFVCLKSDQYHFVYMGVILGLIVFRAKVSFYHTFKMN